MKVPADSNWPVILILASVGSFSIALTPFGQQVIAAAHASFGDGRCSPRTPARPVVLVATTDPDDANRVAATAVPRLYEVLKASSGEGAQQMLRLNAGRIGVIIVDSRSREGRSLAKLAEVIAPEARVIRLPAKHGSTDIVSELIGVI
jgi:hypothetical protein